MAIYVVGVDVGGTNTGVSFFLYLTYDFHENIFIDAVLSRIVSDQCKSFIFVLIIIRLFKLVPEVVATA
jgi:hypothetical protein